MVHLFFELKEKMLMMGDLMGKRILKNSAPSCGIHSKGASELIRSVDTNEKVDLA